MIPPADTLQESVKVDPSGKFVNISAYKFVALDRLPERRLELLNLCKDLKLKGTILLSAEGINLVVAGLRSNIKSLCDFFRTRNEYSGLPIKESESDEQPFTRMLVRVKKEIIAFGVDGIEPALRTSPKLKPRQLRQWLDEGRDVTLLDVRNDYEISLGTFEDARAIGIKNFRNFPAAVRDLPDSIKQKPVVMFCTGGIRCEKAGPLMEREGFENVYQLDGGILQYFADCGGKHYRGECFVFDKRVAVDSELNETETGQCYSCQHLLSKQDQQSANYVAGQHCPYCYRTPTEIMQRTIAVRNRHIDSFCDPLPGSTAYDNHRPLNVPLRFAGLTIDQFLTEYHPHVETGYWSSEIAAGRILYKDQPIESRACVWAGQRIVHLLAGSCEPAVNANIQLIYEDDILIAVDKPAPLPMHPCGRFNRNSLSYILNAVYPGEKIRLTHRLDANTTGVVVMARKQAAAQSLQQQFARATVAKTYLARVHGRPKRKDFESRASISQRPQTSGIRIADSTGQHAWTRFHVARQFADGTSLIECFPQTGRTNQIRLHLWNLGHPVLNDPSYLPNSQLGSSATNDVGDPAMCLHAWKLAIQHPQTGNPLELESPPRDWCESELLH